MLELLQHVQGSSRQSLCSHAKLDFSTHAYIHDIGLPDFMLS